MHTVMRVLCILYIQCTNSILSCLDKCAQRLSSPICYILEALGYSVKRTTCAREHTVRLSTNRENVSKMLQNLAKHGNTCAPKGNYCRMYGICGPSVETPFVPTPSGSR